MRSRLPTPTRLVENLRVLGRRAFGFPRAGRGGFARAGHGPMRVQLISTDGTRRHLRIGYAAIRELLDAPDVKIVNFGDMVAWGEESDRRGDPALPDAAGEACELAFAVPRSDRTGGGGAARSVVWTPGPRPELGADLLVFVGECRADGGTAELVDAVRVAGRLFLEWTLAGRPSPLIWLVPLEPRPSGLGDAAAATRSEGIRRASAQALGAAYLPPVVTPVALAEGARATMPPGALGRDFRTLLDLHGRPRPACDMTGVGA